MEKSRRIFSKVTYGEGNIAETTFLFTPKSAVLDTTDIFEVDMQIVEPLIFHIILEVELFQISPLMRIFLD